MAPRFQVTFDAENPQAQAEFWALVLDYVLQPPPEGFTSWDEFADSIGLSAEQRTHYGACVPPDGDGPRLLFLKVHEGKTAKNRVHLDVPSSDRAAHVERLVRAGATELGEHAEFGSSWTVLRDPEGNEFCVVDAPPD